MERKEFIRIYFKNEAITLLEKTEFIYDKHKKVCEVLNKLDWVQNGNLLDWSDKENISIALLKYFKKMIRSHTTVTKLNDDYFDKFSNSAVLNATKKYNNTFTFAYDIETKDHSEYNSILRIYKFELMPQLQNFQSAKSFIYALIEIFTPISLEVVDRTLYAENEIMELNYLPGWMTYFDNSFKLPKLPEWVEVEKLPNGGHLIITTKEVFNPENNEHKEKARVMLELLQLKG